MRYLLRDGLIVTEQGCFQADLRVRGATIDEIGSNLKSQRGFVEIDCRGQFIFPGLINAHDHLDFNLYPHLGSPPYEDAYAWGADLHRRWSDSIQKIQRIPRRYRLLWGAWKNLFSGVTRVVHHDDPSIHFLLNFPLDVLRRYTFAHSLRFERNLPRTLRMRRKSVPFLIHLAEGQNGSVADEVRHLNELGGLDNRTIAVHLVAVSQSDIALLKHAGASGVWCPASNHYLFHKTAPVDLLAQDIQLALGTDSTLTGSVTLFDELRAAARTGPFSPRQLYAMVTTKPRSIFHLPSSAGALTEGGQADLFLLNRTSDDPYQTLLNARPHDVNFLMRKGRVLFRDERFADKSFDDAPGFRLKLDQRTKLIYDWQFPRFFRAVQPFLSHYEYLGPQ